MAPSTLVLELRRRKREAKRVNRSEARRSNLRASTLATAATTDPDAQGEGEGEAEDGDDYGGDGGGGKNKGRRGRVAQHIATTRTIRKPLTQTQLIEAALEEEERNKEALRDWLKKEEEKRELRRVGRKVVKGPRWTWVSRTVGRLVEEVPESEEKSREKSRGEAEKSQEQDTPQQVTSPKAPQMEESKINPPPLPSAKSQSQSQSPKNNTTIKPAPDAHQPSPVTETEAQPQSEPNVPYTRNYIILSQIPGGLPAELQIVLGSHVEWDKLKIIPSRNRPISVFLYIYKGKTRVTNYTFKQIDKSRSALSPTSPRNTDTLPPASHSLPKKDTERLKRFCGIGMNGLNPVVGGVGEKGMFGRMGWGVCGGWKWGRG